MRRVFSDETRVQKFLDFEAALARAQSGLGIIPQTAAEEIVHHCDAAEIDFVKLERETARIGYPVLPGVNSSLHCAATGSVSGAIGRDHAGRD